MIASQPGLILAAMGLVGFVEAIVAAPRSMFRRAAPLAVALVLVASLPSPWPRHASWHPLDGADLRPSAARQQTMSLTSRPPRLPAPRPTVLTYEDWSSLAWYETGAAWSPSCRPATRSSPSTRRRSPVTGRRSAGPTWQPVSAGYRPAWRDGGRYGADRIVLARRGATTGLISQPAAVAATTPVGDRHLHVVEGNGWDAVTLDPGRP